MKLKAVNLIEMLESGNIKIEDLIIDYWIRLKFDIETYYLKSLNYNHNETLINPLDLVSFASIKHHFENDNTAIMALKHEDVIIRWLAKLYLKGLRYEWVD